MNELTIIKQNGGAYIDSREVAACIGKRHDNLLRDIANYRDIMARGGLLKNEECDFFVESTYVNANNRVMPCYLLSKMACEVIAHKLTGEKGVLFTIAYVRKFNEMEAAEKARTAATPRLKVFNTAVKQILSGYAGIRAEPEHVMGFLREAYRPFDIRVDEPENLNEHILSATDIAILCNVFSSGGRPHSHAVSAIIETIGITPKHIVIIPYGLIGTAARYDFSVYYSVRDWLIHKDFPQSIENPGYGFKYHIYYDRQLSLFDSDVIDLDN